MSNRFSNPKTMPAPRGYTQVVETTGPGRTVYLSGQLGMTPEGAFAGGPGDFRAQATQCFENLKAGLASVGAGFEHVVKITNFFTDMAHLPVFFEVRDTIREHQGAAGLHRDPDRPPRARGRGVRDRGGGGDSGSRGEGCAFEARHGGQARPSGEEGQAQGTALATRLRESRIIAPCQASSMSSAAARRIAS